MAVRTALWKVGAKPQLLADATLAKEQLLEDMIVASPQILSDEWMIVGRQEETGYSGRIDLLALAPDASLVLIELKREKTPRDVVAQALDYAAWVEKLGANDIARIYQRFAPDRNLSDDFKARYGRTLDDETLNENHQIIIVASALDDSTERIVSYLSAREIPINVVSFQVFANGSDQILSRTWLIDPAETQVNASSAASAGASEPWNGEFYCSFGDEQSRSWEDAVEFGFVCAGGGAWYSKTLQVLSPGDRIWVNIPGTGYVGVGEVTGKVEPASTFTVQTANGPKFVLDVATRATYHRQFVNDSEKAEYFVPVKWLQTTTKQNAVYEVGLFGNQNTICKPTTPKWRYTVERLRLHFPGASLAKAVSAR